MRPGCALATRAAHRSGCALVILGEADNASGGSYHLSRSILEPNGVAAGWDSVHHWGAPTPTWGLPGLVARRDR